MRQLTLAGALVAAVLLALIPTHIDASNHGVIEGTVNNGTTGGPLADTKVTLSTFVLTNGTPEQVDEATATTDSNGHYQFEGLDPARSAAYTTSTEYLGMPYSSGMIRFEDSGPTDLTRDLTVFETTQDSSVITVQSRGFVLAGVSPDSGELQIVDLFSLQLDGEKAYVAGDDARSVEFPFPRSASEVNPLPGYDFGDPAIEGTTLYASTPLQPGNTTASLGYRISYTNDSVFLEFGNAYKTNQYRILVPTGVAQLPESVRPIGEGLEDAGTTQIGDQKYRVWIGPEEAAGDSIRFAFENLPTSSMAPNTLSRVEPVALSLAAAIATVAIIVFVVFRRQLHRRQPMTTATRPITSLETRRDDLVTQLRELETAHDADEVDDDVYQSERREILERLRDLSRQSRGMRQEEA